MHRQAGGNAGEGIRDRAQHQHSGTGGADVGYRQRQAVQPLRSVRGEGEVLAIAAGHVEDDQCGPLSLDSV
jgi:hypothetical protein